MKVRDRETGLILKSNNEFVISQWLKYPEKYALVRARPVPRNLELTPNKPTPLAHRAEAPEPKAPATRRLRTKK